MAKWLLGVAKALVSSREKLSVVLNERARSLSVKVRSDINGDKFEIVKVAAFAGVASNEDMIINLCFYLIKAWSKIGLFMGFFFSLKIRFLAVRI